MIKLSSNLGKIVSPQLVSAIIFIGTLSTIFALVGWSYNGIDANHGIYDIELENTSPLKAIIYKGYGYVHDDRGILLGSANLIDGPVIIEPGMSKHIELKVYHKIDIGDLYAYPEGKMFEVRASMDYRIGALRRQKDFSFEASREDIIKAIEYLDNKYL